MGNEKEVIILNKPFLGGWLNGEGKIGHEIIDFFLADNGKYYVYNNPWGACPKTIWVGIRDNENEYGLKKTKDEEYIAKYMVLTGGAHAMGDGENGEDESTNKKGKSKTFNILYVIELKEKIHRKNTGKNLETNQNAIKEIITTKKIKYNGVPLYDIYQSDDSLYLTFEAERIYEAVDILPFTPPQYNFQRNKGYIKSDIYADDYNLLLNLIKDNIGGKLKEMPLQRLGDANESSYHAEKTFLDLIGSTDSEQAFTNMLHALLNDNEVFNHFCQHFQSKGDVIFVGSDYKVEREKRVEDGRMDICGDSEKQRVIIENKIYSGLNGLDEETHTSQLSTYYYKWGKVEGKEEPLCFITAPDYRKAEIEAEIEKFDPSMKKIYKIITYREIADFIEKNKTLLEGDKLISLLFDQIINAFRKWSYKSREELYADLFLQATKDSQKA